MARQHHPCVIVACARPAMLRCHFCHAWCCFEHLVGVSPRATPGDSPTGARDAESAQVAACPSCLQSLLGVLEASR